MNAPDRSTLLSTLQLPDVASNAAEPVICSRCLDDDTLKKRIGSSGMPAECAVCGRIENALPIWHIAVYLDRLIRTNFYGSFPRCEEDDQESPVTDLHAIVQELLGGPHACEDAIVEALIRNELSASNAGAFYSHTACYERKATDARD